MMPPNFQRNAPRRLIGSAVLVAAVSVGVVTACNQDRFPPTSVARVSKSVASAQGLQHFAGSTRRRPSEDRRVQLANEIPGFAGYYLSPTHQLVVLVKDASVNHAGVSTAVAAIRVHLASDGLGLTKRNVPSTVTGVAADYDFATLSSYRDFLSDSVLGSHGVYLVGLDESINRVTVKVLASQPNAIAEVTQALTRHGVPVQAVNFVVGAGLASVADRARAASGRRTMIGLADTRPDTLAGGIAFEDQLLPGLCSIGAIVDSAGKPRFVSAAHCTAEMFNVGHDSVTSTGGYYIGHETADPDGSETCTWYCWYHRGSDAALFSDSSYVSGQYGYKKGVIARTTSRDSVGLNGTLNVTLSSSHPWLFITDTLPASSLTIGQEIDHMGKTTGWQHGVVTATCNDYTDPNDYYGYAAIQIYCTGEAQIYGGEGDSGGPFFLWDGFDGAILAGTANVLDCDHSDWCTSGKDQGTKLMFSTWTAIKTDLGSINPLNNTTVSSPSISGSLDGSSNPYLTWSAVSTTNTSATTQYHVYRTTWDASVQRYTQNAVYLGSTPYLNFTDNPPPFSISAYLGGSPPDGCTYSFIWLTITAYNQGATASSNTLFFRGPANGPGGGAC